jgi:hypothetical protein
MGGAGHMAQRGGSAYPPRGRPPPCGAADGRRGHGAVRNQFLVRSSRRHYPVAMTPAAARKLARYLRSLGWRVRVRRHDAAPGLQFWTVDSLAISVLRAVGR